MNELKTQHTDPLTVIEDYGGNSFEFRRADGYLNFTRFCRAFGKKPSDFLRLTSTKQLQDAIAEDLNSVRESLIVTINGGINPGTWIHPDLGVAAARWISPAFGLWCDRTVRKIIDGEAMLAVPSPVSSAPAIREFTLTEALRLAWEANRDLDAAKELIDEVHSHALMLENKALQVEPLKAQLEESQQLMNEALSNSEKLEHKASEAEARVQTTLANVEPIIELHQQILSRGLDKTWIEAADMLGTGRNRLCDFLREQGVIFKNGNNTCMPKQVHIRAGYFKVKETNRYVSPDTGLEHISTVTEVTMAGIEFLKRKIKESGRHILNEPPPLATK